MGMVGTGGRKRGFPRLRSATPGEDVGLFTRGSRCAPVQRRQLRRLNPGEVGTTRGWGMGVSMDARWTSLRAALVLVLGAAGARAQAPSIMALAPVAGGETRAYAVSGDGSVVVGQGGGTAFLWTSGTGVVDLGGTMATGVSSHGEVVSGYSGSFGTTGQGLRSVRWTSWTRTAMEDLNTFNNGQYSVATGVSPDGGTVVGNAFGGDYSTLETVAYRWNGGSAASMGSTWSTGCTGGAQAASWGGAVVVGNSGSSAPRAFRWTPQGTVYLSQYRGSAQAVTSDGRFAVGWRQDSPASAQVGFRWEQGSPGTLIYIDDLPGGTSQAAANAVSADGTRVVGDGTSAAGQEAFIWDAAHGTRNLRDVLVAEGCSACAGWTLTSARGISADGSVIVGYGVSPQGAVRAWRVSRACYANCDGSATAPVLN